MSSFKWISEGLKSLRIAKSIIGNPDVQARSPQFVGSAAAETWPNKPKRPLSPFIKYTLAVREDMKKQNPDKTPNEILKLCAEQWKQLADSQKQNYSQNFEKDMASYVQAMADYKKALSPQQIQLQQQQKVEKNLKKQKIEMRQRMEALQRPKRPSNSFMQYMRANIAKGTRPDEWKEVVKDLSKKWNSMSEKEKEPYVEKFKKEREIYDVRLKKWEKKMIEMGQQDVVRQETLMAVTKRRVKL